MISFFFYHYITSQASRKSSTIRLNLPDEVNILWIECGLTRN